MKPSGASRVCRLTMAQDVKQLCRRYGLNYVETADLSLRRRRYGKGFGYVDDEGLISDGQAIKDPGHGGRLIQTRQDHLDRHVAEARHPRWSRTSPERFPFAYRVLIPQMTPTLQRREFAYAV